MSTTSPWNKIAQPAPVNLDEIMNEEVARDLQDKEIRKQNRSSCSEEEVSDTIPELPEEVLQALADESTEQNDALIAQMLQMQFDKEHDDLLKRTEEKYNGSSKVSVSFENYRRAPQSFDFQSDSEEEEIEDIRDRKDWDRFDAVQKQLKSTPVSGVKAQSDVLTLHDGVVNGLKNACKLLSFPPEFHTGDGEGFDLKLSNEVFNSLKQHSNCNRSRKRRVDRKEEQATAEFGMDQFTRLLLYKMINSQLLEKVHGVISIGKEAVILHAEGNVQYMLDDPKKPKVPKECVLKVFKTVLSEFKQRGKYINDDHRFKGRLGKITSRKSIYMWAEKEMANLMRLKRAQVQCPDVLQLKNHVLVMSFIGLNHRAAPKLKDAELTDAECLLAYEQVVDAMKKMYTHANLIHADLSEYNILWHDKQCYFIDVSQSVEPSHENAFHFLHRDCQNVINFFSKKGIPDLLTIDELFKSITGCEFTNRVVLLELQESFKMKPHLIDIEEPGLESSFNFDATWGKSKDGTFDRIAADSNNNIPCAEWASHDAALRIFEDVCLDSLQVVDLVAESTGGKYPCRWTVSYEFKDQEAADLDPAEMRKMFKEMDSKKPANTKIRDLPGLVQTGLQPVWNVNYCVVCDCKSIFEELVTNVRVGADRSFQEYIDC